MIELLQTVNENLTAHMHCVLHRSADCRRQRTTLLASFAVGGAVVGSRRRDWQRVAWPGDPVEPPN
jgi:hypothetical protein